MDIALLTHSKRGCFIFSCPELAFRLLNDRVLGFKLVSPCKLSTETRHYYYGHFILAQLNYCFPSQLKPFLIRPPCKSGQIFKSVGGWVFADVRCSDDLSISEKAAKSSSLDLKPTITLQHSLFKARWKGRERKESRENGTVLTPLIFSFLFQIIIFVFLFPLSKNIDNVKPLKKRLISSVPFVPFLRKQFIIFFDALILG